MKKLSGNGTIRSSKTPDCRIILSSKDIIVIDSRDLSGFYRRDDSRIQRLLNFIKL
jgi:hypothetical protein